MEAVYDPEIIFAASFLLGVPEQQPPPELCAMVGMLLSILSNLVATGHMATEHVNCGYCHCGTEYFILFHSILSLYIFFTYT